MICYYHQEKRIRATRYVISYSTILPYELLQLPLYCYNNLKIIFCCIIFGLHRYEKSLMKNNYDYSSNIIRKVLLSMPTFLLVWKNTMKEKEFVFAKIKTFVSIYPSSVMFLMINEDGKKLSEKQLRVQLRNIINLTIKFYECE